MKLNLSELLLILFVAMATVTSGCSSDSSLFLIGEADAIIADGMTVLVFEAEVEFREKPLADGKKVLFRASVPELFDSETSLGERSDGSRPQGEKELSVKAQGGKARIYLLAPTSAEPSEITIEASYTTVNKDVRSDERIISVLPPPLIAGGFGDGCSIRW